jgi:hypothetical protein
MKVGLLGEHYPIKFFSGSLTFVTPWRTIEDTHLEHSRVMLLQVILIENPLFGAGFVYPLKFLPMFLKN